jgi:putative transposase
VWEISIRRSVLLTSPCGDRGVVRCQPPDRALQHRHHLCWRQVALRSARNHGLGQVKNRGVRDVLMVVCDGLKGLPDAVGAVWDKTIVQTCIVHLLRNSFKYASKRDWGELAKDLKPVYTAASEAEALDRFAEFSGKWEKRYLAIIRLWENAWAEFVPFLAFDWEIRTIFCTTNAIES